MCALCETVMGVVTDVDREVELSYFLWLPALCVYDEQCSNKNIYVYVPGLCDDVLYLNQYVYVTTREEL